MGCLNSPKFPVQVQVKMGEGVCLSYISIENGEFKKEFEKNRGENKVQGSNTLKTSNKCFGGGSEVRS